MTPAEEHSNISISLVGYGRLARHLAPTLRRAGFQIVQWCIRNGDVHDKIKEEYGITPVLDVCDFNRKTDLILLMVNDEAIDEVAARLPQGVGLVCHTSGMTPMDALPRSDRGVFYPLNTFSGQHSNWDYDTPIFVQGSTPEAIKLLTRVGQQISHRVREISYKELRYIHLAAVISQNFSNHLIAQAEKILKSHHLDRQVIQPLLMSMIRNLEHSPAKSNQTGPAIRGDQKTIDEQQALLSLDPELKNLYNILTELIQTTDFD